MSKYRTQLAYDTGGGPYLQVRNTAIYHKEPPKRNVGARIRFFRLKHQMTQYDLANNAGLSQPTISSFENGKRKPDLLTLSIIAAGLGLTVERLCGEEVRT